MDDEFDTSVDTSSFDDTGSDFSDTSSFDTSTDVGEIMDDSSFEVADTLDESDFSDYDMSGDSLEVDDLMSDTSDENIETLDTSDLDSDVTEGDSEGIESLMDDTATDEFSEVGDTLEETDFGVESDIVDLMDEAALESTDETADVSGEEIAETDEISELLSEDVSDSVDETVESLEDTEVVEDLSEDTTDDIESLMDDSGEEVTDITEETGDITAEMEEETSDVSDLMDETDMSTEEVSDITDESLKDVVEETDTVEDMAEETTSDITDDIVADVSDNDASDNVAETIEDDVGEVVSDLSEGDVSGENVEAMEDAGDSSAYDRLSEYYSSHNYGQGDYAEYSQDPEWQELNNAYLQEIGQEPIEYGSETDASAYDRLSEYYSSHNYGQGDYAEYSKDPEWQALNNEYLQELGQEPIDYSENDWTDTHVEDFRDELVALGIPEDSPELDAIIENEQQGIDEINSSTPIDESGTEDLLDGVEEIIDETPAETNEGVDDGEQLEVEGSQDVDLGQAMEERILDNHSIPNSQELSEQLDEQENIVLTPEEFANIINMETNPERLEKLKELLQSGNITIDNPNIEMSEDAEPAFQKVLKRDEMELLEAGDRAITDRLEVKADDYRDKGFDEAQIADFLKADKSEYQKEFLADAFPGQDVDPNVFRHINETSDSTAVGEISEIKPIENLNGWLKDINPNYDAFDVDSPYSNNCGSCTYAVYQRLEGNPDICATAENIGYNSEMEALTGMEQVSMSPQEIEARLLEQGDGAHAIIGIDRSYGPGHWFNAACIDGKVVAIDGQSGEINDWPPDYGDVVNWEMSIKKGE